MWDDIAAVKAAATDIVNKIDSKFSDYRVAIVSYEDFPVSPYGSAECGDAPYHAVLGFSNDKSAIISALQGLSLRCGADWQESVYSALIRSINTEGLGDWRENVKKVIIIMGDAPPHDPEPFTGYTMASVISTAEAVDPATIYPISIGWSSTAYAYFSGLAEGTGGEVFTAPTAGDVVEAIIEAIETALESPVAEANGPYTGTVGSPITFDASGSYDPDGTIALYEWDWENDGTYDESTTLPTIDHTWSAEYSGMVKLRVTDNDGLSGIDIASVEVINNPPIANAGLDQTVEQSFYQGADVTLNGSGSYDPDGDDLTYKWIWDSGDATGINPIITLPLGATTATLTVDDGIATDYDTVVITIVDTTPPTVDAGSDITVEQATRAGTEVTLSGSASDICDASLDYEWIEDSIVIGNALTVTKVFNLGAHTLTLKATDDSGNVGTDIVVVNVIDTTLPDLSVTPSVTILWPPNHKYITVIIDYTVSDICDAEPEVTLVSVTSDEPENGKCDGNTLNDIVIVDNTTIKLRAETQCMSDGRVYTINYSATDNSGNVGTASAIVTVPVHHNGEAIDSGVQYIVTP